jgi:hypothetical protein
MLINFDDGSTFARGAAGYNTVPGFELSEHIVVMIEIGNVSTLKEAVIDTSSPYLVFTSEVANACGLDLGQPEARGKARIQGELVEGAIYLVDLALLADEDNGDTLVSEVWAFVPDGAFDPDPLPPTLIGLKRCLDGFLFAVDPFRQVFYFG